MIFFLLIAGLSIYVWSLINVNPKELLPHSIDVTDIPISGHSRTMNPNQPDKDPSPPISDEMDITKMIDDVLRLRSQCKHFTYELPKSAMDFFGREDNIEELVSRLVTNSVQLLNINGPLGCGKSQLAIRLGYRLIEESLSVSYIDVSDRNFEQFRDNMRDRKKESLPILPKVSYVHYPLSEKNYTSIHDVVLMKELSNWSQTLTCSTVLILDNCDSVRDHHTFANFFQHLVSTSSSPLKVIVTSQNYLESFESWTISELNMEGSMKLLNKVAPSVDKWHLDKLLALLGGCPLALKITGNVLQNSKDRNIEPILHQIELHNLNQASSQHQQFQSLLSIMYDFLLPDVRVCGYYLSLFPGSFDRVSGGNIMAALRCDESIDVFMERSLLEEYFLGDEYRIKMPSPVKEYFTKKKDEPKTNDKHKTMNRKDFKRKFITNYVDLIVLDIMYPFRLRSPDEYNLKFSIESHNIHTLTTILFTNRIPNSTLSLKEMAVLLPLTLEGWMSRYRILDHHRLYKQLLIDMNPVCKFLPGSRCVNFYSQLISDVYHLECNSAYLGFIQLVQTIYEGNEKCGALYMNGTIITKLRVWNRLGPSIQSFISTAGLLSFKYLHWLIKCFGFFITLYAFLIEYLNLHKKREDVYICFILVLPAVMFTLGIFLLYSTGNSDLAVILHIYIPSTVFILVLLLCCCYGTAYRLVFSYLFRIWCIILFFVALVKMIFWVYSLFTVPLTNLILL